MPQTFPAPRPRIQTTGTVLMIRPAAFRSNPQTVASNAFQRAPGVVPAALEQAAAEAEFDGLLAALRGAGVEVVVEPDLADPSTPDAVFPNNWLSTHHNGVVVLYPMMAPNRRRERRVDVIERLGSEHGFRVSEVVDLSFHETEGRFLEGTGSMVLDRVNRVAYACLSPRTDLDVLAEFGQRLDYEPLVFGASDAGGVPVYHTNVMMAVGEGFAVVCAEAIDDPVQRAAVVGKLAATGHAVVEIDRSQMQRFAGNMLALAGPDDSQLLAMSAQAAAALTPAQRETLEAYARVVVAPIDGIESSGGGSVRCMLAEIHLPRTG